MDYCNSPSCGVYRDLFLRRSLSVARKGFNHAMQPTPPFRCNVSVLRPQRISASGSQRRSRPARGSLPGASERESSTSRKRPRYVPRLALHTRSGRIETDRWLDQRPLRFCGDGPRKRRSLWSSQGCSAHLAWLSYRSETPQRSYQNCF